MGVVSPIQAELLPILCSNNGYWLPWQQGSVRCKFKGHHSIGRPRKTPVWCKQRARIFKGAQVIARRSCHVGHNAIFHIFGWKIEKILIFINKTTYRMWMPPGCVIRAINGVDRSSVQKVITTVRVHQQKAYWRPSWTPSWIWQLSSTQILVDF